MRRIELDAEGSRDQVYEELRAAKAARERVCVHCADGNSMTGIVMADWLVSTYEPLPGRRSHPGLRAHCSRVSLAQSERVLVPPFAHS